MQKLTVRDLYILPFKRNDKNQTITNHRSAIQEVPDTRRSICSERELNALLDHDTHRSIHNLSLTPRSMTAQTKVKDNRFIIKFPQYK